MRGLLLIVTPLACAAISLSWLVAGTAPLRLRAAQLGSDADRLRKQTQAAKDEAHAISQFLRKEELLIRGAVKEIRTRTSPLPRPSDAYPIVIALAEQSGVTIESLNAATPKPAIVKAVSEVGESDLPRNSVASFELIPVSVAVAGAPEHLLDFIDLIEHQDRPITIQRAEIMRDEKRFLKASARLMLNVLASRG